MTRKCPGDKGEYMLHINSPELGHKWPKYGQEIVQKKATENWPYTGRFGL